MELPRVPKGPAAPSKSAHEALLASLRRSAGLPEPNSKSPHEALMRAAGFHPLTDVIVDPAIRQVVSDEYTKVLEEKIAQQNWELEFLRGIAKASKDFVSADRMPRDDTVRIGRRGKAKQRLYSAVDKYTQYMRNR